MEKNKPTGVTRYNYSPLIELIEVNSDPSALRRDLLQCYFLIAERLSYSGDSAGNGTGEALYSLQQFIEALDKLTIGEPSTTETTDIIADKGEESLKIKRLRATIKHQADLILTLSDVYNAEAESNWKLYDQLSKLKAGKMGEINECIDRLHASALKMKEMAEGETEIITAYGTPCI